MPDTILLVDTSGSLMGTGMQWLKLGLKRFLTRHDGKWISSMKERAALVEFGDKTGVRHNLTGDMNVLKDVVDTMTARGTTPMADALQATLNEVLPQVRADRLGELTILPTVILFTDGKPDFPAEVRKVISEIKTLAVPVRIVCVGVDRCDEQLLRWIAKQTQGVFFRARNVMELPHFYHMLATLPTFIERHAQVIVSKQNWNPRLADYYREQGIPASREELMLLMQLVASVAPVSDTRLLASSVANTAYGTQPPNSHRIDVAVPEKIKSRRLHRASSRLRYSERDRPVYLRPFLYSLYVLLFMITLVFMIWITVSASLSHQMGLYPLRTENAIFMSGWTLLLISAVGSFASSLLCTSNIKQPRLDWDTLAPRLSSLSITALIGALAMVFAFCMAASSGLVSPLMHRFVFLLISCSLVATMWGYTAAQTLNQALVFGMYLAWASVSVASTLLMMVTALITTHILPNVWTSPVKALWALCESKIPEVICYIQNRFNCTGLLFPGGPYCGDSHVTHSTPCLEAIQGMEVSQMYTLSLAMGLWLACAVGMTVASNSLWKSCNSDEKK